MMKRPPKKVTMEEARKAHHMRWPRLSHGTSMVTGMMSASILGSWTEDEEEEEEEEEEEDASRLRWPLDWDEQWRPGLRLLLVQLSFCSAESRAPPACVGSPSPLTQAHTLPCHSPDGVGNGQGTEKHLQAAQFTFTCCGWPADWELSTTTVQDLKAKPKAETPP
ncbi:hypothetical protein H920_01671 [Fukomys damarensis]|uniref:Uncharacterized protein n=1 Tax=Fukomys damarensis TaxID=885580 RepID=A0A091DY23_FUKDA|nr:hypothetical protein H920_01671 [Fukomys damarensis]